MARRGWGYEGEWSGVGETTRGSGQEGVELGWEVVLRGWRYYGRWSKGVELLRGLLGRRMGYYVKWSGGGGASMASGLEGVELLYRSGQEGVELVGEVVELLLLLRDAR